jgi:hypothetical protein
VTSLGEEAGRKALDAEMQNARQPDSHVGSVDGNSAPASAALKVKDEELALRPTESRCTTSSSSSGVGTSLQLSPKKSKTRQRATALPKAYMQCNVLNLGVVIADMLVELILINDEVLPKAGILTRFHSRYDFPATASQTNLCRAPPTISVRDYLDRLICHATLSPPLLLAMVFYIDRLCLLYPAFTINSLTVHRFLITAATVAAKGLSDSFWTNHTYARVGGVSTKELAMLELDFLDRLDWNIVPKAETLDDYYRSLVTRADNFVLEDGSDDGEQDGTADKPDSSPSEKAEEHKSTNPDSGQPGKS